MPERRLEPRLEANAPAVLTPLAAVTTRLQGSVVNVSGRGLKVRANALSDEMPSNGDVCRVQSGDDLMLCEVRYRLMEGESADIGFAILHWIKAGKLNRLVKEFVRLTASDTSLTVATQH